MPIAEPIFVGNWKMNFRQSEAEEYLRQFEKLFQAKANGTVDTVLAVPFTALGTVSHWLQGKKGIALAAQNLHWLDSGAQTGEISAPMLLDYGVSFVLVGHSERRQFYGETDENVSKRAAAAITHGITPIICVGDSLAEFDAGKSEAAVLGQLDKSLAGIGGEQAEKIIIAYEPVWAIGTGRAATPEIAGNMHIKIRGFLKKRWGNVGEAVRIIYGGSATALNISALLECKDIDGALPGSTSLKPEFFSALIEHGRKSWQP